MMYALSLVSDFSAGLIIRVMIFLHHVLVFAFWSGNNCHVERLVMNPVEGMPGIYQTQHDNVENGCKSQSAKSLIFFYRHWCDNAFTYIQMKSLTSVVPFSCCTWHKSCSNIFWKNKVFQRTDGQARKWTTTKRNPLMAAGLYQLHVGR